MNDTIIYRHWEPGDDDAVLKFLPNTNPDWFRNKFDEPNNDLEPEGIRLAFFGERVVGHAMGESTSIFIEEKLQKFGTVSGVFVAPDIRRQGIATNLMRDMHTYFEKKGYRGSILETDNDEARQLYLKIGYQQVTRELQALLQPERTDSQLILTDTTLEDLSALHQLNKNWARQNFPVGWAPDDMAIDPDNMNDARVLRCDGDIIGYVYWDEPSLGFPHVRIHDPVVPDAAPIEVIKSLQAAISVPLVWRTCEGSKYEKPLRSLGYSLERMLGSTMLFSFGPEIDLTQHSRSP